MRLVRRLGGVLGGAAGAVGLVLCVAGLVGVSVGFVEVARRLERVFDRADNTLAATQENIRAVADRLRRTEADLDAVRKREAEAAAEPPDRRAGRRVASRKAVEALGVDVAEARSTLVKATEAALVANGLLDALAELPLVERVNVDADQLKEASVRLGELAERSTRLAEIMGRPAPASPAEVDGESSRAVEAIRKPIALAEAGAVRLESGRQSIAAARTRVMRWVNGLAVALTVILVWVGAGQLSLLVHGWKLVRR